MFDNLICCSENCSSSSERGCLVACTERWAQLGFPSMLKVGKASPAVPEMQS